jgi:hypothetical protein
VKIIRVEKCKGCPHIDTLYGEYPGEKDIDFCSHPDAYGHHLDNLDIIHPDCPLEDAKEANDASF